MARIARIVLPRKPHLICQSSDQSIFNSDKRRRAYLDILADCAATYKVKVLAWSVLRKRSFLVVTPPSAEALSSFMRVAHTRYARMLHASGFKGEVTPRRFASCALDNPTALEAIKYVELQPVAARLAKTATAYAYGSAAVRTKSGGHAREMLTVVKAVTGKVRGWAKWLKDALPKERQDYLAMRMRTGKPAGRPAFVRGVEKIVGMNLSRGRGRPRKS